jgi:hypothetical protein
MGMDMKWLKYPKNKPKPDSYVIVLALGSASPFGLYYHSRRGFVFETDIAYAPFEGENEIRYFMQMDEIEVPDNWNEERVGKRKGYDDEVE